MHLLQIPPELLADGIVRDCLHEDDISGDVHVLGEAALHALRDHGAGHGVAFLQHHSNMDNIVTERLVVDTLCNKIR